MRLALGLLVSACCTAGTLGFAGCGSDETAAATDDAAPEATPEVDGSIPDAAPDVADDVVEHDVTPVQTFCGVLSDSMKPPRFCDDFDDHDATNAWTASAILPTTSVLAEDPNQSVSAPLSVVMATKALAAGAQANVSLRETLLTSVSHPVFQFQARFSQTAFTGGSVVIANLYLSVTDHYFSLYLYDPDATPPGPALVETVNGGKDLVHHTLASVPPANTWASTVIDLDLVAGLANVSFAGTKVLADEPIVKQVGTEATFRIGAVYLTGPLPDFTANFDNVTLDF